MKKKPEAPEGAPGQMPWESNEEERNGDAGLIGPRGNLKLDPAVLLAPSLGIVGGNRE